MACPNLGSASSEIHCFCNAIGPAIREPERRGSALRTAMPSTVIRRFDYSPERRELMVEFTTGRRYLYSDVPEEAAAALRSAFSKGAHFNRGIRGRFACSEIDVDGD